eukprot:1898271-Rhodomonas_salina.2
MTVEESQQSWPRVVLLTFIPTLTLTSSSAKNPSQFSLSCPPLAQYRTRCTRSHRSTAHRVALVPHSLYQKPSQYRTPFCLGTALSVPQGSAVPEKAIPVPEELISGPEEALLVQHTVYQKLSQYRNKLSWFRTSCTSPLCQYNGTTHRVPVRYLSTGHRLGR